MLALERDEPVLQVFWAVIVWHAAMLGAGAGFSKQRTGHFPSTEILLLAVRDWR